MFTQRYDNVVRTFLEPMLLECFQNVIMQRYTITFCKPYKKLSMIDVPITLQSNVVGTFLEPMLLECFQNVIMQRYTITFCKPYKKLSMIDVPITLESNVL